MANHKPNFVILSIDGVPAPLVREFTKQGIMPNLARLTEKYPIHQMRSVQPTVSCVAWASYMTGCNPGKHGIYGFIDRRPGSFDLEFPNARMMATENIWEMLSKAGKTVFGMNVPTTFPPRPVNGILIGGFLTPTLDKAAYPASVAEYLKSIDYRIDSDAQLARQNKKAMLADLDTALDNRMNAMFHFLDQQNWDFFHTHIMGSDRINHFLLQKLHDNDPEFAPAFQAYYRRIDSYIGKLLDRIPEETPLMIFSDHGFCPIKQEVQLSRYLVETGWTTLADKVAHPLSINPEKSKAYCLIPGRLFINLKGREPGGTVPIEEYQKTRQQLADTLLKLHDPDTKQPVIKKVLTREQLYWPTGSTGPSGITPTEISKLPHPFNKAADLIAIPHDGYDLKLGLAGQTCFQKTALEGMHTYDDAFMVARNIDLPQNNLEILMLAKPILNRLNVQPPPHLDGNEPATTPNNLF